ncbi:hypothetical protein GGR56DRAFT_627075 [Xylariaceae sp. FL0804]|nr:hypothetical protein GGR56DRAFT_627075 [Xylariaceae sp. FL0804]
MSPYGSSLANSHAAGVCFLYEALPILTLIVEISSADPGDILVCLSSTRWRLSSSHFLQQSCKMDGKGDLEEARRFAAEMKMSSATKSSGKKKRSRGGSNVWQGISQPSFVQGYNNGQTQAVRAKNGQADDGPTRAPAARVRHQQRSAWEGPLVTSDMFEADAFFAPRLVNQKQSAPTTANPQAPTHQPPMTMRGGESAVDSQSQRPSTTPPQAHYGGGFGAQPTASHAIRSAHGAGQPDKGHYPVANPSNLAHTSHGSSTKPQDIPRDGEASLADLGGGWYAAPQGNEGSVAQEHSVTGMGSRRLDKSQLMEAGQVHGRNESQDVEMGGMESQPSTTKRPGLQGSMWNPKNKQPGKPDTEKPAHAFPANTIITSGTTRGFGLGSSR